MDPQQLVHALLRMGLTQAEIAAHAGLAQSTVSKVARGAVRDVLSRSYLQLKALYDEMSAAQPVPSEVIRTQGAPPVPDTARTTADA